MNQPAAITPPKKSGGALKWILLGCGGIVLLGMAGFGVMVYLVYKNVNRDPAKVEATAQEILNFEKPPGYKGFFSMSLMGFKVASLIKGEPGQPDVATIGLMAIPPGNVDPDQLRAQMRQTMEKEGQHQEIVEKRKKESFKVRGKDVDASVDVTIHKGADSRMLQYTMVVDGPSGNPVFLSISGPEMQADHAWIQKFLDTVK